jgi:hypothetical protein
MQVNYVKLIYLLQNYINIQNIMEIGIKLVNW